MELGLFIILGLAGLIGFWRYHSITFTGFSVAIFFSLAVLLSTGQNVVQTTNASEQQYNATGSLVLNTTRTDTAVIIDDMQAPVSWIFYILGIVSIFLFLKNVTTFGGWT